MLSVIIPCYRDPIVNKTVGGILNCFKSEFEIIVVLDGYWPDEPILSDPHVRVVHLGNNVGMRGAINAGVRISRGEYILKMDAHCMVDDGMDEKLLSVHEDNWIQVPRRKRLDVDNWILRDTDKPDVDYMYLDGDIMGHSCRGKNADPELKKILIDDTEIFQGSCYLLKKDFFDKIGILDDVNFNGTGHEAAEIAFKAKQHGGRIVVNKNTWYAHARVPRKYSKNKDKSRSYIKVLYGKSL